MYRIMPNVKLGGKGGIPFQAGGFSRDENPLLIPDGSAAGHFLLSSVLCQLADSLRRDRDSNPGRGFPLNTLAVCCFQPLSHLSLFSFFISLFGLGPKPPFLAAFACFSS